MKHIEDLRQYQVDAVEETLRTPETLILADIGAGKTIITLTSIIARDQYPVLIVAPLRVCDLVWEQEAADWTHTRELTFSHVTGTPGKRTDALAPGYDIYLINYENLQWLMDNPCPLPGFTTIVWDEISKMKSIGARYKAVRKWAKTIPNRIGLTGSVRGNSPLGIWPQANLIDNTCALMRSKTAFKKRWFYQNDYKGYDFKPFPGALEEIAELMAPFTYRMDPDDYQQLPDLVTNDIMIRLPTQAFNDYNQMAKTYVLDVLDDTDPDQIEAVNAAVLTGKLRQLAAGSAYLDSPGVPAVYKVHDEKMAALHGLVDELDGEPLLLFYDFRYQQGAVLAEFPQAQALDVESVDAWNRGEVQILVAHPASAGHGLNLQAGGHNVCFMSINWSLELYEQAIGRLRRTGQTMPVFCHRLLVEDTIDLDVRDSLAGDGDEQDAILKLLEKYT